MSGSRGRAAGPNTPSPAAAEQLHAEQLQAEERARTAVLRHFPEPEVIKQYVDILVSRGIEWGLLGPSEGARIWSRHVTNSIPHAGLFPAASHALDVGSGAGLPGIPLALLREDLTVVLLEPLQRRAEFLQLAVTELGLSARVRVVRGRVEEASGDFDVLTARAVAPVARLARWCAPLLRRGSVMLALKGASVEQEIASAAKDLRRLGLAAGALSVSYAPDLPSGRIAKVTAVEPARRE